MIPEPFATQAACRKCPPPVDLLLSLASEFRPVDASAVHRMLDELADELSSAGALPPRDALPACGEILGEELRHEPWGAISRRSVMIDCVLEDGRGHRTLLAAIYQAAAARAGIPLIVVADRRHAFIAHPGIGEPLVLDPAHPSIGLIPADELEGRVTRRCPHQLVLGVLDELTDRGRRGGDLSTAMHAARLRMVLPTEPRTQERLRSELTGVTAQLN